MCVCAFCANVVGVCILCGAVLLFSVLGGCSSFGLVCFVYVLFVRLLFGLLLCGLVLLPYSVFIALLVKVFVLCVLVRECGVGLLFCVVLCCRIMVCCFGLTVVALCMCFCECVVV